MTSTTSAGTSTAPFTTVTAVTVASPKIPQFVGDSWRPAAACLLGAVPLALASAALVGASVAVSAAGLPPRPASAAPVRPAAALSLGSVPFTTVFTGQPTDPKLPAASGD
jgi:hypothetical protein